MLEDETKNLISINDKKLTQYILNVMKMVCVCVCMLNVTEVIM